MTDHRRTHTLRDRRRHELHLCGGAVDFEAAFRREADTSISDLIASVAYPERVAAAILGGTIPLGVGSPISDVDLVLVIDDIEAIRDVPSNGRSTAVLRGNLVGEAETLMVTEALTLVNGIEVDMQFVLLKRVKEVSLELSRATAWVSLSGQNTQILGRIRSGWILSSTERFQVACSQLLTGRALDVHCATRYFIVALQDLEKAKAALLDDLAMALYLGKACVQGCCCAYFAGNGYPYLGNRWLRLLNPSKSPASRSIASKLGPLARRGVELVFPTLAQSRDAAGEYLKQVTEFAYDIKRMMEKDTAIRAALRLSPQVYDPVWGLAPAGEMAGLAGESGVGNGVPAREMPAGLIGPDGVLR
jgi:hypothetical protein